MKMVIFAGNSQILSFRCSFAIVEWISNLIHFNQCLSGSAICYKIDNAEHALAAHQKISMLEFALLFVTF